MTEIEVKNICFKYDKVEVLKNLSFSIKENTTTILLGLGGGDSFGVGLIYGMINDYTMQDTIEFAVATSYLKHSIEGDFNMVTMKY